MVNGMRLELVRHCLRTVLAILAGWPSTAIADDDSVAFFSDKIEPLLVAHCYECHGEDAEGGLRLDSPDALARGGNSGQLVVAGRPGRSLLMRALSYEDDELQMPPDGQLDASDIAWFQQWIRQGAIDPRAKRNNQRPQLDHWAFRGPRAVNPPRVSDPSWPINEVDHFVLARLDTAKMKPSKDANRATLIRRVYYDLVGLPPTYDDIERFVRDDADNAYSRLVDDLLASSQFGERWARHWLDVARYADAGDRQKRFPFSYTYRDWVIEALNRNMPYDEFVTMQLAADLLPNGDANDLAALGFLTLGYNYFREIPEVIDDRIDVVSRGLMGFTVSCARCHDHKFDPVSTRDYYSLFNVFQNTKELSWDPVPMTDLTDEGLDAYRKHVQVRKDAIPEYIEKRLSILTDEFRQPTTLAKYMRAAEISADLTNARLEAFSKTENLSLYMLRRWRDMLNEQRERNGSPLRVWFAFAALEPESFEQQSRELCDRLETSSRIVSEVKASVPQSFRELSVRFATALCKAAEQVENQGTRLDTFDRDLLQLLVLGPDSPTSIPKADFHKVQTEGDSNNVRGLRDKVTEALVGFSYRGAPPHASAVEDRRENVPGFVFVRGNPNNRGASVTRRFLTAFSPSGASFEQGSGRLELAQCIVAPENPLTARVAVNRVWGHLFGQPIVKTPSDFGEQGAAPTHPELLDYLAIQFVQRCWSIKDLIRTLVVSRTYRQSSQDHAEYRESDPTNSLLWRMNRRRKDFESMRDGMLAVASNLQTGSRGLPVGIDSIPSPPRRTIYGFIDRNLLSPVYSTFDFASPDQHCPQRFRTTIPQQALHLLNGHFVAEQSRRLTTLKGFRSAKGATAKVQNMFTTVLGRQPTDSELRHALDYVEPELDHQLDIVEGQSPWSYGLGHLEGGRITGFRPFTYFVDNRWQATSMLPAPDSGYAHLKATGGAPGDDVAHAVVRRWTAPVSGEFRINGSCSHKVTDSPLCDGIEIHVFNGNKACLFNRSLRNEDVDISVDVGHVSAGETIDFIVSCGKNSIDDDFRSSVTMKAVFKTDAESASAWNSKDGFSGPIGRPLDVWQRFGQVLLLSNEFLTVD